MFTITVTTLPSLDIASLHSIIYILIVSLDIASVLILCVGVIKALIAFFTNGLRDITRRQRLDDISANNLIKQHLGSYILLSLEILIAADIIKSILEPSLDDILILGAIVIIRTIISYFLERETNNARANNQSSHQIKHREMQVNNKTPSSKQRNKNKRAQNNRLQKADKLKEK